MNEKKHSYAARNFQDSDKDEIMRLFDRTYADYGGYSLRTPEYWQWCCLDRPDVEREGIFVVVDQDRRIAGYSVIGKSGNIWELCYDRCLEGNKIVSLLLDTANQYLKQVGAVSIMVNGLREDEILQKACGKFGFTALPTPQMFISVLDFRRLVSLIMESKKRELANTSKESILVKLRDAPPWIEDQLLIKVGQENVRVSGSDEAHTIRLETDTSTFGSILLGLTSPLKCLCHLKLRVVPFWKTLTLIKILNLIRLDTEFFFPLSEYG